MWQCGCLIPSAVPEVPLSQGAGLGEAVAALFMGHRYPAVLMGYSFSPCVGCHPGPLCNTEQNKAKQNPEQDRPGAESCRLPLASGLSASWLQRKWRKEERDPGLVPELSLEGAEGKLTHIFVYVATGLLGN